jgi:hypothetical protein
MEQEFENNLADSADDGAESRLEKAERIRQSVREKKAAGIDRLDILVELGPVNRELGEPVWLSEEVFGPWGWADVHALKRREREERELSERREAERREASRKEAESQARRRHAQELARLFAEHADLFRPVLRHILAEAHFEEGRRQ